MRQPRFHLFTAFVLSIIWSLLLTIGVLRAQDTGNNQIVVNGAHLAEQNNTQNLSLFFTITDVNGQPVPNATLDQATITIGTIIYPATLSTPQTPLSLALVFDTSGSMGPTGPTLRAAANQAVVKATTGTIFSVFTFNQQITQLLPFTPDANAVQGAINRITSFGGGTCLYDAADAAVTALRSSNPNGRNAVLLFTDGKDELANGNICSKITVDGLIAHAGQLPGAIPIYTIGLRGTQPIAEGPLTTIANATHGLFNFGSIDKLGAMFQNMISALNSQHEAQATICAPKGNQQAILGLKSGSQQLSQVAGFQATTTCVPSTATSTPMPLSISISPFQFSADKEQLTFQVLQQGSGTVSKYHVQIKYKTSNIEVGGSFGDFVIDAKTPIQIPTNDIRTESLIITVQALDANSAPIGAPASSEVLLDRPTMTPTTGLTPTLAPTLTPTLPPLGISGFQFAASSETLTFTVSKPTDPAVVRYEVHIQYKQSGIQVAGQYGDFKIDVTNQIKIPTAGIQDGGLVIDIQPLDSTGAPLGSPSQAEVLLQRPTPTATAPIGLTVQSISRDDVGHQLVVQLHTDNAKAATGYTVIVVDKTGIQRYSQVYNAPPGPEIHIPDSSFAADDYTIRIELTVPGQATPVVATQTITYTPPLPPQKSLLEQISSNPLLIVVLAVIALAFIILIGVMISRIFGSRRSAPIYVPPSASGVGAAIAEGTMVAPIEAASGNAIPNPKAHLTVVKTPTMPPVKDQVIRHTPFVLGSQGGSDQPTDLDFNDDAAISRNHATITYDSDGRYLITDTSRNGVKVNDQKITPRQPFPLPLNTDVLIDLSNATRLLFRANTEPVVAPPPVPASSPAPAKPAVKPGAKPSAAPAVAFNEATSPDKTMVPGVSVPADSDSTYVGDAAELTPAEYLQQRQPLPGSVHAAFTIMVADRIAANTRWEVDKTPYLVGRTSPENSGNLLTKDVSREQMALVFDANRMQFAIFDRESTHGTYLDGALLTPKTLYWLDPKHVYELRFDSHQTTHLRFEYRID